MHQTCTHQVYPHHFLVCCLRYNQTVGMAAVDDEIKKNRDKVRGKVWK